jgi:hypothetical protein
MTDPVDTGLSQIEDDAACEGWIMARSKESSRSKAADLIVDEGGRWVKVG